MAFRRMFVLLALAAVFWMHGLQCLTGDASAAAAGEVVSTGHPAADHAALSAAAPATDGPATPAHDDPHDGLREGPHDGPREGPHDGPREGLPTHLGSACLAVLSVALAALAAALLAVPAIRVVPPSSHRTPRWRSVPSVRRPPDLFALCVQRT